MMKLPELDSFGKILCVQPHPDDADISMGATIAKLSQKGIKVYYVTITDGSAGTRDESLVGKKLAEIRKREQEKAAEILGVHELLWLGFEDLGDYTIEQVREKLIQIIRKVEPDAVFTVDPFAPYEVHPDHLKCGMSTAQAVSLYRLPKLFPGTSNHDVTAIGFFNTAFPNTFYPIEHEHLSRKFQAISEHRSQFDERSLQVLFSYLTERSKAYSPVEGQLVEPFKVLPPVALHVISEAYML
ncbi:MAG: LmbE family protein [Thermotoga sp. 50_1627]|nr:MAG: LmbE family protein [Thermotoga sp. 50_64]KUK24644.1 MAG: LmbE family protein [Thermotoga sp. 50_1627]MBC7117242.1 PIG-L family deacetylase [Pseudothermotoga sp.]HBT39563.1 PIG-L family deacetylase [Pseudothermotoga sp.]HCO98368.1 PIG-L family deacetylase [Pseudothermotoga sp.]